MPRITTYRGEVQQEQQQESEQPLQASLYSGEIVTGVQAVAWGGSNSSHDIAIASSGGGSNISRSSNNLRSSSSSRSSSGSSSRSSSSNSISLLPLPTLEWDATGAHVLLQARPLYFVCIPFLPQCPHVVGVNHHYQHYHHHHHHHYHHHHHQHHPIRCCRHCQSTALQYCRCLLDYPNKRGTPTTTNNNHSSSYLETNSSSTTMDNTSSRSSSTIDSTSSSSSKSTINSSSSSTSAMDSTTSSSSTVNNSSNSSSSSMDNSSNSSSSSTMKSSSNSMNNSSNSSSSSSMNNSSNSSSSSMDNSSNSSSSSMKNSSNSMDNSSNSGSMNNSLLNSGSSSEYLMSNHNSSHRRDHHSNSSEFVSSSGCRWSSKKSSQDGRSGLSSCMAATATTSTTTTCCCSNCCCVGGDSQWCCGQAAYCAACRAAMTNTKKHTTDTSTSSSSSSSSSSASSCYTNAAVVYASSDPPVQRRRAGIGGGEPVVVEEESTGAARQPCRDNSQGSAGEAERRVGAAEVTPAAAGGGDDDGGGVGGRSGSGGGGGRNDVVVADNFLTNNAKSGDGVPAPPPAAAISLSSTSTSTGATVAPKCNTERAKYLLQTGDRLIIEGSPQSGKTFLLKGSAQLLAANKQQPQADERRCDGGCSGGDCADYARCCHCCVSAATTTTNSSSCDKTHTCVNRCSHCHSCGCLNTCSKRCPTCSRDICGVVPHALLSSPPSHHRRHYYVEKALKAIHVVNIYTPLQLLLVVRCLPALVAARPALRIVALDGAIRPQAAAAAAAAVHFSLILRTPFFFPSDSSSAVKRHFNTRRKRRRSTRPPVVDAATVAAEYSTKAGKGATLTAEDGRSSASPERLVESSSKNTKETDVSVSTIEQLNSIGQHIRPKRRRSRRRSSTCDVADSGTTPSLVSPRQCSGEIQPPDKYSSPWRVHTSPSQKHRGNTSCKRRSNMLCCSSSSIRPTTGISSTNTPPTLRSKNLDTTGDRTRSKDNPQREANSRCSSTSSSCGYNVRENSVQAPARSRETKTEKNDPGTTVGHKIVPKKQMLTMAVQQLLHIQTQKELLLVYTKEIPANRVSSGVSASVAKSNLPDKHGNEEAAANRKASHNSVKDGLPICVATFDIAAAANASKSKNRVCCCCRLHCHAGLGDGPQHAAQACHIRSTSYHVSTSSTSATTGTNTSTSNNGRFNTMSHNCTVITSSSTSGDTSTISSLNGVSVKHSVENNDSSNDTHCLEMPSESVAVCAASNSAPAVKKVHHDALGVPSEQRRSQVGARQHATVGAPSDLPPSSIDNVLCRNSWFWARRSRSCYSSNSSSDAVFAAVAGDVPNAEDGNTCVWCCTRRRQMNVVWETPLRPQRSAAATYRLQVVVNDMHNVPSASYRGLCHWTLRLFMQGT